MDGMLVHRRVTIRNKICRHPFIYQGRVVWKPANSNPGLKVNLCNNYCSIKVLSIAYVLCSLRLLMHAQKWRSKNINPENTLLKSYKNKIKILANPKLALSTVEQSGPGWREALWELSVFTKNTTQCFRSGLEPRLLDPETSALTMRPPWLPQQLWREIMPKNFFLNCLANPHATWRVYGN